MHMGINEAGYYHLIGAINHSGVSRNSKFAYLGNDAVIYEHICQGDGHQFIVYHLAIFQDNSTPDFDILLLCHIAVCFK